MRNVVFTSQHIAIWHPLDNADGFPPNETDGNATAVRTGLP